MVKYWKMIYFWFQYSTWRKHIFCWRSHSFKKNVKTVIAQYNNDHENKPATENLKILYIASVQVSGLQVYLANTLWHIVYDAGDMRQTEPQLSTATMNENTNIITMTSLKPHFKNNVKLWGRITPQLGDWIRHPLNAENIFNSVKAKLHQ